MDVHCILCVHGESYSLWQINIFPPLYLSIYLSVFSYALTEVSREPLHAQWILSSQAHVIGSPSLPPNLFLFLWFITSSLFIYWFIPFPNLLFCQAASIWLILSLASSLLSSLCLSLPSSSVLTPSRCSPKRGYPTLLPALTPFPLVLPSPRSLQTCIWWFPALSSVRLFLLPPLFCLLSYIIFSVLTTSLSYFLLHYSSWLSPAHFLGCETTSIFSCTAI